MVDSTAEQINNRPELSFEEGMEILRGSEETKMIASSLGIIAEDVMSSEDDELLVDAEGLLNFLRKLTIRIQKNDDTAVVSEKPLGIYKVDEKGKYIKNPYYEKVWQLRKKMKAHLFSGRPKSYRPFEDSGLTEYFQGSFELIQGKTVPTTRLFPTDMPGLFLVQVYNPQNNFAYEYLYYHSSVPGKEEKRILPGVIDKVIFQPPEVHNREVDSFLEKELKIKQPVVLPEPPYNQ